MIQIIQRAIDKGARSVLVRDDLIRAGAEVVVLDDRLSIAELLKLGRAFSDFEPKNLIRNVLPVVDSIVGNSEVLELDEGALASLAVFRGDLISSENVSVTIIDSRGLETGEEEAIDEIKRRGFNVNLTKAQITEETVINFSTENFEEAVLLGRFIEPIPKFKFNQKLSNDLILILGEDFEAFPLVPRSYEEIDVIARSALPVSESLSELLEQTTGLINSSNSFLPIRQGQVSPMKLVQEINGRPPAGQKCG